MTPPDPSSYVPGLRGGAAAPTISGCKAWLRSFWAELTLSEISGSMGDLGTFLPLVVGLVKVNGLDLGTTLIFTGLYNVITGIIFRVPMPVQPMKMIAAAAMSSTPLTVPQIMAAGMFVSGAVLLLGATRMMGVVQSLLPDAVIKGMQLGLGLDLARKGFQQVWYLNSKSPPARGWWGVEGLLLGFFALMFILITVYSRRDASAPRPAPILPTTAPCPAGGAAGGLDSTDKLDASPSSASALVAAPAATPASSPARPFSSPALLDSSSGKEGGGPSRGLDSLSMSSRASSSDESGSVQSTSSSNGEAQAPILHGAGAQSKGSRPRGALDSPAGAQAQRGWRGRLQAALDWLDRQLSASIGGEPATDGHRGGGCGSSPRIGISSPPGESRGFHIPSALVIVIIGVVLTLVCTPDILHSLHLGPSKPQVLVPSIQDWRTGIIQAGLPQLPLTTFNSVVSVCQLAADLFPDRPASPNAVAASVGAMNLVGGWFGAMPSCMGAGGLAAQARFGARTGAAPIFLGLLKLSLGLLFGSSLFRLLQAFPQPLMGAMLVYAGLQLAACARTQRGERGVALMLLTAAVVLAMANVAIGVAAGLIAAYSLLACDLFKEWLGPRLRPPAGQHSF